MKRMRSTPWLLGLGLGMLVAGLAACEASATDPQTTKPSAGAAPADVQVGEAKFNANCAACHGPRGTGSKQGPPLVHKIYEPNHHADVAFQRAAANGVRAHHWEFGNMPKIDAVTADDVDHIIKYVRWLQREAGIF